MDFKESLSIQHIAHCTDEMLADYLKKARFILCASHYEGFGIPVLEGIYNGAYPILSDIPVFHEWVGTTGYYFNQQATLSLADTLKLAALEKKEITPNVLERYHTKFNYKTNANILWSSITANRAK